MSPELLLPEKFGFEDRRRTKESDRYALGMVILEVLSGQAPYEGYADFIAAQKITGGKYPKRPEGEWFTGDLWRTLKQCWSSKPKLRPTTQAILECLEQCSTALKFSPPSTVKTSGWMSIINRVPR